MHNVTMTKLQNGADVRTDSVTGICVDYPNIGESFTMISESLTFGHDLRIIRTSTVKSIDKQDNIIIFTTENSIYQLMLHEQIDK